MREHPLLMLLLILVVVPLAILEPPTWVWFAVLGPLFVLVLPLALVFRELRGWRNPLDVDPGDKRLRERLGDLDLDSEYLAELGWTELDTFELGGSTPRVTRVFRRGDDATYLDASHRKNEIRYEIRTDFTDGASLTSATLRVAADPPRPPAAWIEILEGASLDDLIDGHLASVAFLASRGHAVAAGARDTARFRAVYAGWCEETVGHWRGHFLWPYRLIAWQTLERGKSRLGSIEQIFARHPALAAEDPRPRERPSAVPAPAAPRRRRRLPGLGTLVGHGFGAIRVLLALAVVGLAALSQLWPKSTDPRWEALPVEGGVEWVELDLDGTMLVAANGFTAGDLWRSEDGGRSFTASGFDTEMVLRVDLVDGWVCTAAKGFLRCDRGDERSVARLDEDENGRFAVATPDGLLWAASNRMRLASPERLSGGAAVEPPGNGAIADAIVLDDGTVLAAGTGVFASEDGGRSFQTRHATGEGDERVHALAARGDRVYAAGGHLVDGFLLVSDDRGRSFRRLPLPAAAPSRILLPAVNPDVLIVALGGAALPGDLYLSTDAGESFVALGCPGRTPETVAIHDGQLYCGSASLLTGRGLWRMPVADALPDVALPSGSDQPDGSPGLSSASQ